MSAHGAGPGQPPEVTLFQLPGGLLPGEAPPPREPSAGVARCPSCEGPPQLSRFPRYEALTYEPLLYCTRCYGFWARGDSLTRGAADPHSDHPALRQVPVLTRCKSCFGRPDADLNCRKCSRPLAPLPCPACDTAMSRARQDGVLLDICTPCEGVWFETGELPAMFGLTGYPPSLLERMAPPGQPVAEERGRGPLIADLIAVALRLFLP